VQTDEFTLRTSELIEAGRFLHSRGWVPATSGNFSARLGRDHIAITVSGRHKGRLTPGDIMLVSADGMALDGKTPSAETGLHTMLYRRYPEVRAALHAHSPGAVLASRLFDEEIVLEGHELLKCLPGISTHQASVTIPIFANDQDIDRLAAQVDDYLAGHIETPGFIIAGHGIYTWGARVDDAMRHLEALEFMFDIESRLYGVKSS
jgi:methylthioribulose-1-phosphate dehydratase